jgi:riboflavin biosynthesis pyrimidine reductase
MRQPERRADDDEIRRLVTVEDRSGRWPLREIGNDWSREYYGGPFHLFEPPRNRTAMSLVFVQSRNGNTDAANPADLGGGPTDKRLLYEGLTRVAADAVLAGASTVGHSVFFGVSHPELIALRQALGLPRHPAQIVVSEAGNLDLSSPVFSTPEAPVFVLAGAQCMQKQSREIGRRPWITMIPLEEGGLEAAVDRLRSDYRVARISVVGGRRTATSFADAGLIQDLYLTTTAIDGGEPDTPWYAGRHAPRLDVIVRKKEDAPVDPILFDHLALGQPR